MVMGLGQVAVFDKRILMSSYDQHQRSNFFDRTPYLQMADDLNLTGQDLTEPMREGKTLMLRQDSGVKVGGQDRTHTQHRVTRTRTRCTPRILRWFVGSVG